MANSAPERRETARFAPESLHDWARVEELLLLYQLSIKLLGCEEPDEIIRVALDLLYDRTDAAVVGFLWVGDDGQLRRKLVLPEDSDQRVALSQLLTDLVCRQRHAVWIADQAAGQTAKLEHYADAVCVPLVNKRGQPGGIVIGAIHVYRQQGHFRQSDFELTISVANIVSVALVRARSHLSLQSNYQRLVESSPGYDELIGESLPMQQLKSKLARVARAKGCVLIRGESGTGKELVARAIHAASTRADRPMLSVNCAAIPADLMESQLFGHRTGAFTGADRDHVGYFEQADLATLNTLAGRLKTTADNNDLQPIAEAAELLQNQLQEEKELLDVVRTTNQLLDLCRATQDAYLSNCDPARGGSGVAPVTRQLVPG